MSPRIKRIITDADTDLAELWMALSILVFGLSIANPWSSVYGAGPAFRALIEAHISEEMFGGATVAAALLHVAVLLRRGYLGRLTVMIIQTTGCAGTATMFWYGNPRGYGCWLFTVAAVMGLIMVSRLAVMLETARRWDAIQTTLWAEKTTGG